MATAQSYRTESKHGGTTWHNGNGRLHREDGPAVTWPNGNEEWWFMGNRHRDDGPAVTYKCGYAVWYRHGDVHCLSGPAILQTCGCWHHEGQCKELMVNPDYSRQEWYVDGRRFTEEEFYRYVDTTTGEVFVPVGKTLQHDTRHLD